MITLVTGTSGHLGANLIRRLLDERKAQKGQERFRVLLRSGSNNRAVDGLDVERVYGDLRDRDAVRAAVRGVSRIYHTAAQVSTVAGGERDIYETNVIGTRNLLDAALDENKAGKKVQRVVVTSSFSAVGHTPNRPSTELDPFYPFEDHMPYEVSKAWTEHECLRAVAKGLDVVIVTSTAILGPHDYKPSRMGQVLTNVANGKMLAYIPGGFEFVAARDIAEAHLLGMQKGRTGEKYIIATEFVTFDDLMEMMSQVTGRPKPPLRLPPPVMAVAAHVSTWVIRRFFPKVTPLVTPGAVRILGLHRRADTSKAKTELGFRPTSVRQALEEAYAWLCAEGKIKEPRRKPMVAPADEPHHRQNGMAPARRAASSAASAQT